MKRRILIADVQRTVAADYGISPGEIVAKTPGLTEPRYMAIKLAKDLTRKSLTQIGLHFQRDHATIIYALRRVGQIYDEDPHFAARLRRLTRQLGGDREIEPEPHIQLSFLHGPLFDLAGPSPLI